MEATAPVNPAADIISACGSYVQAVDAVMGLGRALWAVAFSNRDGAGLSNKPPFCWKLCLKDLDESISSEPGFEDGSLLPNLLAALRACQLSFKDLDGWERFTRTTLQSLALARELLRDAGPDHELRYFVMTNIRRRWSRVLSSDTAHEIQVLSGLLNAAIYLRAGLDRNERVRVRDDQSLLLSRLWESMRSGYSRHKGESQSGLSQNWRYADILLILSLARGLDATRDWTRAIQVFIECCLAVNYMQAHDRKHGWIIFRTRTIDSAFLLSNLFGMKTGIRGFDELFGGGGLILSDELVLDESRQIGGRAVLTMGRFGSGKSLLTMQFATELARKGGLAYIMTVEQTPGEFVYTLGSVCAPPPRDLVTFAWDSAAARVALENRQPDRGAVVILNPLKDSFQDFLTTFKKDLETMRRYPLRMVVVDPINAIPRTSSARSMVRAETVDMLQGAKRAGTNIWLVAEEASDQTGDPSHYQNIADTVIRLSTEQSAGYSQRYFEITKSRFQREQRGKHPFSIAPGTGFAIFPSAAAVSARIQSRSVRPPDMPIHFGLPALEEILGKGAICAGDVIVLQGPAGSHKTSLGLLFLLGTAKASGGFAKHTRMQSLLLTTRDTRPTIRRLLSSISPQIREKNIKAPHDIRVCSIDRRLCQTGIYSATNRRRVLER